MRLRASLLGERILTGKLNISFHCVVDVAQLNHQIYPEDHRFSFPKRPYFPNSIQMATRGEPLKDGSRPKQAAGNLPTRKACRISIHIL